MILSSRSHKSVRYFSFGKNCISKNELYVQPHWTGLSIITKKLLKLLTVMKEKTYLYKLLILFFIYA